MQRRPWLRRHVRWQTRFGSWVDRTGVSSITQHLAADPELRITPQAVYFWVAGTYIPEPRRAQALVELARGELSLDDIYAHRRELAQLSQRDGTDG